MTEFRYPDPDISVIMSVFNGEKYIARALLSMLVQTYDNFEIIVIDDGSSDNTPDIITRIDDKRIRFFSQKNMGLTKSLNKAITLARGKWIARHDADDFSIRTRFARQIEYLNNNQEIGLLGTSCFIQPERPGIINEIYDYPQSHDDILSAFPVYNPFVHGSMMIKKELLEKYGGYNETYRYVQDYDLWARLLPVTKTHNLATPLYVRSVHRNTSQMKVDKNSIAKEIQNQYLSDNKSIQITSKKVPLIKSVSLYPIFTIANGWNRSIAESLYYMSCEAGKYGLPSFGMRLQSLIYYPWRIIRKTKNA